MKIGILECGRMPDDLSAQLGHYPDMFKALLDGQGFEFQSWHVEGLVFPQHVTDMDGWLITGSRHGVYEDHAFIPLLEQFIREAFAAHLPVVGICFGHQVMAQALGGEVRKFPGGWAIGPQDYTFDTGPVHLNAWHQDQVTRPPKGAQTVGMNSFCAHAALLYPGHGFSVQSHPEFTDAVLQGLIDRRGPGIVPEPLLAEAQRRLGSADSSPMKERIGAFFKQHARVPS